MFTNLFYKCLLTAFAVKSFNFTSITGAAKQTYSSTAGDALKFGVDVTSNSSWPSLGVVLTSTSSGAGGGVIFGDGNTPPALTDTKLSGNMITTINATRVITKEASDNSASLTVIYTLTNTGSSPITIAEVGVIWNATSNNNYSQAEYKGLLERTVLESPVTIPAGGIGQVTYTISMEAPTA